VNFAADQLLEGDLADIQLSKFNRRLLGREAVVNIGSAEISGLPADFLNDDF
jgi:hypothetical protein